jgi:hypothetical protein
MRRRQFLHAFGALAIIRPTLASPLKNQSPLNLMPAFWQVYTSALNQDPAARIGALAKDFFLPEAGQYSAAGFNGAGSHGRLLDDRVQNWLTRLDQIVIPVQDVSNNLAGAWAGHAKRFKAAGLIPRHDLGGCFLPSLFSFTGYSRIWNGKPMLFLAPDGIVEQLGPNPQLNVLIDHEAFHIFHDYAAPDLRGALLWMRLWREGLATLASADLNPAATLAQLLMDDALAALPRSDIAAIAGRVMGALDQAEGYDSLFDIGHHDIFPNRVGYVLGLMAARMIAARHSLVEMASMPASTVRPALVAALSQLANGG